jgi:hypothetical protein
VCKTRTTKDTVIGRLESDDMRLLGIASGKRLAAVFKTVTIPSCLVNAEGMDGAVGDPGEFFFGQS